MYNFSAIEREGITIDFAQEQSSQSIAVTIQLQIIIISIYLITLSFSLSSHLSIRVPSKYSSPPAN